MKTNALINSRWLFALLGIAVAGGCSSQDPGALAYFHPNLAQGPDAGAQDQPSGDAGNPSNALDAAVGTDGGNPSPVVDAGSPADAGATEASAPPPNAFTNAPPYASSPPGTQAQSHHGFSLVGRSCFDCHGGANPSSGIRFEIAGRVFADANATTPAADVEVRVVGNGGAAVSAHSDLSGYFWQKSAVTLPLPALAGARNAATTKLMAGPISDPAKGGGCNSCHDGATTSVMHVP